MNNLRREPDSRSLAKERQSGLGKLEERLEMEALGRKLRRQLLGSGAEPIPTHSNHPAQAHRSPQSKSSLRGKNSPHPRRDLACPTVLKPDC